MIDPAEPKLNFLFMDQLRGFFFNPFRSDGLSFIAPEPNPVDLSLKPADPDNDGGGFQRGLTCRAKCTVNVPQSVYRFASLLLSGRFDHGTDTALKLPHIINSKEKIDSAGNIRDGYQVAFKYFPTDVQTTCNSVGSRLRGDAERFIKLLRWQQEIDGPHVLFEGLPPLYWNAGGTEYWAVGFPVQGRSGRSPVGITWDADDHREMQGIWAKADIVEPLAHELLREAKGAMGSSPRSALLIAASAVEAGLKVPDLHSRRGKPFPEWNKLKPLFKIINELAEDRNTLTHKGEMPERAAVNLPQALAAVSDLLYIFDVLEGHDWAKCNVQFSTIKLLGWPKPRRERYFVKMEIGAG